MKKMYPVMAQDGLTSANLQAGLSRALPPSVMGQRGLTSAKSSDSIGRASGSATRANDNLVERNCVG